MEWFFGGTYAFVVLCGFLKGDIPAGIAVVIIKLCNVAVRLGLILLTGALLYLGFLMDVKEWETDYLHLYTTDIVSLTIAFLWVLFPVARLSLMNISLSCNLFYKPKKTWGDMFIHLLTIGTSVITIFDSQQFFAEVGEKLISYTLSAEKAALLPTYGAGAVDYSYAILTATGFVAYITLGLTSHR